MFAQNRSGELSRTVFKLLACVGERENDEFARQGIQQRCEESLHITHRQL